MNIKEVQRIQLMVTSRVSDSFGWGRDRLQRVEHLQRSSDLHGFIISHQKMHLISMQRQIVVKMIKCIPHCIHLSSAGLKLINAL